MISKSAITGLLPRAWPEIAPPPRRRRVPQRGRPLGGDPFRHRLVQAAHHQVRQQVADDVADRDGVGMRGVQDAALGYFHPKRCQRGPVVRNLRRHHALDPEAGIGPAIRRRNVDAAGGKPGGAGEIDLDAVIEDFHRGGEAHRFLIAVGIDFVLIGAARDAGDFRQGGAMRTVEDEAGQRIQAGHFEFVHHLDQAFGAGIVAGTQRIDVAFQFHRQPRSGSDEIEKGFVRLSFGETFDDRDVHAFFEHRTALGAHAEAADVDDMGGVGEQADDFPVMKGRCDDGQVVQVAGAQPRIVGDVMVAGAHRRRRGISSGSGRRIPPWS